MGTITSGVGLISGIDIENVVTQLMAIEKRPMTMLQTRVQALTTQRTAFLSLSALIMAARNAASRFDEASMFRKKKAVSGNENIVKATASEKAVAGDYSLTVRSLASTQQMVSSGFRTADSTPVGAGQITIESALARLNPSTSLDTLRGGDGIRRGVIRITDRSGASVQIDLSAALTMNDVIDAINNQSTVDVTASVSGGHLILTDHTGQTVSDLSVADVGTGKAAADLGIAGRVSGSSLVGSDIVYLTPDTPLEALNDGNGVRRDGSLNDFQITLRDGSTIDVSLSDNLRNDTRLAALNDGAGVRLGTIRITDRNDNQVDVDLSGAVYMEDITTAIRSAVQGAGLQVDVSMVNSHLQITNTGGADPTGRIQVEDLGGGHAAQDLGIAKDVTGKALIGSDLYDVSTVGDVIRAINLDSQNNGTLVASLSSTGTGITLTDTSAVAGTTTVVALKDSQGNDSRSAADLGILGSSDTGVIESSPLLAGLGTVLLRSLNGGQGVELGVVRLTARDGTTTEVDLRGLSSLSQVLDALNAVSTTSKISAAVNATGNGIVLTDGSGGSGNLVVADVTGHAARDLHLTIDAPVGRVNSGNLQRRYISETTRLESLNGGRGIVRGKFTITAGNGATATIDLTQGNETTLADVIQEINAGNMGVTASINTKGDGLLLTDTTGGSGQLTVTEAGSTTAADLGILGTAAAGAGTIDGSFERTVTIDSDDTLNDVVGKINSAKVGVRASVLNDGSRLNPYRLVLTSERSGRQGELLIDPGETGASFSLLTRAQDAIAFIGDPASGQSLLLSGSSNTLDNAIPGVKLDLLATSSSPVAVTVSQDVDSIVSDLSTFVRTFNSVIDKIDELTSFNSETFEKGVLFGDATIDRVKSALYNVLRKTVSGAGVYSRLNQIGLTLGDGAKLRFDEDKFRQALESNREDVEALFTKAGEGIGVLIDKTLGNLTTSGSGVIDRHNTSLRDQEDLLNDRIAAMQVLLDSKQQRLYQQFYAMEQALATLQSQQSALSSLDNLLSYVRSTSSGTSGSSK